VSSSTLLTCSCAGTNSKNGGPPGTSKEWLGSRGSTGDEQGIAEDEQGVVEDELWRARTAVAVHKGFGGIGERERRARFELEFKGNRSKDLGVEFYRGGRKRERARGERKGRPVAIHGGGGYLH
jgi:hypothetical protein